MDTKIAPKNSPVVNNAGYLVRQRNGIDFEVSKWEDDSEPAAIYRVRQGRRQWFCNSPGCRRSKKCKHAFIVTAWLKRPKGGEKMPERMMKENGRSF